MSHLMVKYQTFLPAFGKKGVHSPFNNLLMVLKSEVVPGNYNSCKVWKGKSKSVIIHRWHYIQYAKEYKIIRIDK